jgi:hypothetical protein
MAYTGDLGFIDSERGVRVVFVDRLSEYVVEVDRRVDGAWQHESSETFQRPRVTEPQPDYREIAERIIGEAS